MECSAPYKRVIDVLFQAGLGTGRTERLATMFERADELVRDVADKSVRDAVAILVACLHYGRFFYVKKEQVLPTWPDFDVTSLKLNSDFLAIVRIFWFGVHQHYEKRNRERKFIPGAIETISAAVFALLGRPPKINFETLDTTAFHKAVFAGVMDLVFVNGHASGDYWFGTDGEPLVRDMHTVVSGERLIAGLVTRIEPKNHRPFFLVGPVFPVAHDELVNWGGQLYRPAVEEVQLNHMSGEVEILKTFTLSHLQVYRRIHRVLLPASPERAVSTLVNFLMDETDFLTYITLETASATLPREHLAVLRKNGFALKGMNPSKNFREDLRCHYEALVRRANTSKLSDLALLPSQEFLWNQRENISETVSNLELQVIWIDDEPTVSINELRLQELIEKTKGTKDEVTVNGKTIVFRVNLNQSNGLPITGTLSQVKATYSLRQILRGLNPPEIPSPYIPDAVPTIVPVKAGKKGSSTQTLGYWALVCGLEEWTYDWALYADRGQAVEIHKIASGRLRRQIALLQCVSA